VFTKNKHNIVDRLQDFRTSGLPDFRTSGLPDFWTHGETDSNTPSD
jgi:hypothetical protein